MLALTRPQQNTPTTPSGAIRYSVQMCIRFECTGTGARARVSRTGTSASEKMIDARLNS